MGTAFCTAYKHFISYDHYSIEQKPRQGLIRNNGLVPSCILSKKNKMLIMPRNYFEEKILYFDSIRNITPKAKDFHSLFFNEEKANKRKINFQSVKLCHKQLYQLEFKQENHNIFPTKNLPLDWLVWYDHYNKKLQNPDYAYGYNFLTTGYYQDSTRNNNQGLINFERNNNKNLIPTKPTTLHEIFSKYTRYLHKAGKSTTVQYNNLMVHKNFEQDIFYIGNTKKYSYWNVFPNKESSRFMYSLSTNENVPVGFENLYYDEKYDMHRSDTLNISRTNKLKNSEENPD